MKENSPIHFSPRENLLMTLLNKVIKEYKLLWELTRKTKALKIVEIIEISSVPGETQFTIQIVNKNCVLNLSAAEIINNNYNLNDFSDFHAEMIRHAARGKLIEFLRLSDQEPRYKIISKKLDRESQQYIFTIETEGNIRFERTAEELSYDKDILLNMNTEDVYNVGFTQGSESVLRERVAILLMKKRDKNE
jgi:hypothetical protein